jgi:hypothetical protein
MEKSAKLDTQPMESSGCKNAPIRDEKAQYSGVLHREVQYCLHICVRHSGSTQARSPGGSLCSGGTLRTDEAHRGLILCKSPVFPAAGQFPLYFYFY